MSDLTNEQLGERIAADLNEAEARMEAADVPARLQRRFKAGHALISDVSEDLIGSGQVQPFSGGEPKP
jgi:hypothetical protein